MNTPERSKAIARALAVQSDGLPGDFAAQVAALAEAATAARSSRWNVALSIIAFVAMLGVCVAGWLRFGTPELGSVMLLQPVVDAAASQPWLVIGVAGVAIVQLLTFRRRAAI